MKKMWVTVLSAILFFLAGCLPSPVDPGNGTTDPSGSVKNAYAKAALAQFETVNEQMWKNPNGRLSDNTTGKYTATLWTYSAYFTTAAKVLKVHHNEETVALARKALSELEWYKVSNKDAYASDNGKEAPVFYDDNVWLVVGFLEMYGVLKEAELLQKAIAVQEFIYGGWQEDLGGGLLWREFDSATTADKDFVRNTCINAPAAMTSAMLYKVTGEQKYLDWAERLFIWTRDTLKNSALGTYFDCVDRTGKVEKAQFTYNSGCMLSSAALLYDITGKQVYLDELTDTLEGSKTLFANAHISGQDHGDFYYDNPWFRVYLYQGYLDAYLYGGDEFKGYIDGAIKAYDFAVSKNYYDSFGFLYDYWDASTRPNDSTAGYSVGGREALGNCESMAIFAEYKDAVSEE